MKQSIFGPAGNGPSFYSEGNNSSTQMPAWLAKMDLGAYEYAGGRGIKINEDMARRLGEEANNAGIAVSIHAPYFINLANTDPARRQKSREYLYQAAQTVRFMGGERVIFHPGSGTGNREAAMQLALAEMEILILEVMEPFGVILCPETMGKLNQLGSLDEILTLCSVDARFLPTLDFGHINAITQGGLKDRSDFARVLDRVGDRLGEDRMRRVHIHFSHIEYGPSGEKRHLDFSDEVYGPFFEPLALELASRGMEATIICESRDTMAEDAIKMKSIYMDGLKTLL